MNQLNCSELADSIMRQMCERDNSFSADISNFYLIWASSLVLFMHAGFAMLSAGALRTKNTRNILISIVMDLTVCAVAWYLVGFAFAFGNDQGGFIGSSFWVGIDVGSSATGRSSFYFWLFQFTFAATGATIVSGAVSERARFETYLLYSFYMSAWVCEFAGFIIHSKRYCTNRWFEDPIVVHWVWGGGFLSLGNGEGKSLMGSGVVDFAGCGPVHMVGGLAGAIGSKIMGPRIGRFDPETNEAFPMPGHSSPLATLGVFILWVGWLGFNSGSVINITGGGGTTASRAAVNTILSSSTGALSSLLVSYVRHSDREFDLNMALNGALAGLVSITASCAFVEMWAALSIGVIGGIVYVFSSHLTLYVLKIDDPLDATPVHLFCGMWGIIAGAFFTNPVLLVPFFAPRPDTITQVPAGVFYGGNTFLTIYPDGSTSPGGSVKGALVANAVVEICCILAWVFVFMTPLFLFLQKMEVLRVAPDIELVGLDISHHGGEAYPDVVTMWNYTDAKKVNKTNGVSESTADTGNDRTAPPIGSNTTSGPEDGVASAPQQLTAPPPVSGATQTKTPDLGSVRRDKSSSSPVFKIVLQSDTGGKSSMGPIPVVVLKDPEIASVDGPSSSEGPAQLSSMAIN